MTQPPHAYITPDLHLPQPLPFPHYYPSRCTRWPLRPLTQPAYNPAETPTAPKLMPAKYRNCSGRAKTAASTQCPSSAIDTNDISVPANDERCAAGTRVYISSCVVRSKVQRPKRVRERERKRRGVRNRGVVVIVVVVGRARRMSWKEKMEGGDGEGGEGWRDAGEGE